MIDSDVLCAHYGEVEFVQMPPKSMRNLSCTDNLHNRTKRSPKPKKRSAVDGVIHPVVQQINAQNDCHKQLHRKLREMLETYIRHSKKNMYGRRA